MISPQDRRQAVELVKEAVAQGGGVLSGPASVWVLRSARISNGPSPPKMKTVVLILSALIVR